MTASSYDFYEGLTNTIVFEFAIEMIPACLPNCVSGYCFWSFSLEGVSIVRRGEDTVCLIASVSCWVALCCSGESGPVPDPFISDVVSVDSSGVVLGCLRWVWGCWCLGSYRLLLDLCAKASVERSLRTRFLLVLWLFLFFLVLFLMMRRLSLMRVMRLLMRRIF